MKKTLAGLMLAFALFVPGVLMTACGQAKVVSFEVELTNTEYEFVQNQVVVEWGNKVDISPEDFVVTATLDNDKTKVLSVKSAVKDGYTFSSTIPDDTITPIGEYTLTFEYGDLAPYEIELVVEKANMDMSAVTWNYTDPIGYDGTEKTVAVTGLPSGVSVTYQGDVTATAIGQYTVTAIFSVVGPNAANYNPISNMTLNWEITKGTIDTSSMSWNYSAPFVYDGTEKSVQLSGLPAGCGIAYSGTTSATNAGDYTATAIISVDTTLYNAVEPIELNWKIEKADLAPVVSVSEIEKVYAAEDITITPEMITDLPANYAVKAITGDVTAKNVGTYNITLSFEYTGEGAANYNEIANLNWTWEITKAPLTLTPFAQATYGQEVTDSGFEGAFLGDDDESVLKGEAEYAHNYEVGNNAGDYALTLSGLTADNYAITFEEGTLVVEKAPLTITPYASSIVYGERFIDATKGYNAEGFVCGDTKNVITGYLAYTTTYVQFGAPGEYKIGVHEGDPGITASNYYFIFAEGTITVSKRPLTITANDVEVEVGLEAQHAGVTYEGFAGAETESVLSGTLAYDFGGYNPETAQVGDTFAITPSGLTSENYEITFIPGTLTVVLPEGLQEEIDGIALSANEFDYVQDTQPTLEVDATTIPEQVEIGTISVKEGEAILPGTYTAVIELNYTGSETYILKPIERTFTINKVEIDPSEIDALNSLALEQETFVYDGTEKVVTLSNLPAWAKVSESTNASGTVVGSWGATFVITVSDESFYVAFESVSITRSWNITRADLTITVKDNTIAYGEEAANAGFTANGLVGEDTEDVITGFTYYYGGYEIGSSVGEYVLTIENANAGNYNITIVPGKLIVEKAEIDLSNATWGTQTQFAYTGEAVTPTLENLPENVEVAYTYYNESETECTPTEVGAYTAVAAITVDANYLIINQPQIFEFTISDNNSVFATLTLNGEAFAEADLVDGIRFAYDSVLEFTMIEGYYAADDKGNEISSITFDFYNNINVINVYAGEIGDEPIKSFMFGSPYYLEKYSINGTEYTYEQENDIELNLDLNQDEIIIDFDEKYLEMYDFTIDYYTTTGDYGELNIGAVPYTIQGAHILENFMIMGGEKNSYQTSIIWVNVNQHNPFVSETFTLAGFGATTETDYANQTNITLNNQVIVSASFVDSDDTTYTNFKAFSDFALTKEVNLLDLASYDYNLTYFAVYDEENALVGIVTKKIIHNFTTTAGFATGPVFETQAFNTNGSDVAKVEFTVTNEDVEVSATLNGEAEIALSAPQTEDVAFRFELVYGTGETAKTYFFESTWTVLMHHDASTFLNATGIVANTNPNHKENYQIAGNNFNLSTSNFFNAGNIDDFADDLAYLEFDVLEDYNLSERNLVKIGNEVFIELAFTDAQAADAGKCILKVFFKGSYDNNTSIEVTIFSMTDGSENEIEIINDTITLDDFATQVLAVVPSNVYAYVVITDGEGQEVVNNSEDGYIMMQFKAAGTYSLIVYATDGTTKTYTIDVKGVYVPPLEITVGEDKYILEVSFQGELTGDYYADKDGNLIAFMGEDKTALVDQDGNLAITSFKSSMLVGAVVADQDGNVLSATQLAEGFNLKVLKTDDENQYPYVKLKVTMQAENQQQDTAIIMYLTDVQDTTILKVVIDEQTTLKATMPVDGKEINGDFDFEDAEIATTFTAFLGKEAQSKINKETNTFTISSFEFIYEGTYVDAVGQKTITSPENVALAVGNEDGLVYVSFGIVYSVEDIDLIVIVMLVLDQPLFQITYEGTTLTEFMFQEENQAPTFVGDFETSQAQGVTTFVGYLGAYEGEIPQTITIDKAMCNYGTSFKDGFSNAELTQPFKNVALTVGTYNEIPAVSILVDDDIQIYLLLAEGYPVTFTFGNETFNVRAEDMNYDFGDLQMVETGLEVYIAEEVTEFTITFKELFNDYSYAVITDAEAITSLTSGAVTFAELIEDGKVYIPEAGETTVTAPLTFVGGAATILLCLEGCTGNEAGMEELGAYLIPLTIYVIAQE